MKMIAPALLALLLLVGCAAEETFETVADVWAEPSLSEPGSICVSLPGETALPVMENDNGRLYLCNDYEIHIQTMSAGDLSGTIQSMSGYTLEEVSVMTTEQSGMTRYDYVWASAGETGDWLGRGVIVDDGTYHYTMTVLRDAESVESSQVVWDGVFNSFRIA